jgi:hypothetical protein
MASRAVEREMHELETRRQAVAPELAKQVRSRARKKSNDTHAVDREVKSSKKTEAAAVTEVDRGPSKRWAPASALPAMPNLPGFHCEYVRRDDRVRGDHANLVKHIQESWEFCRKTDFPKMFLPTQRLTDYGECIGNDSAILMKLPLEMKAQRDAHYNQRRDKTTRAINKPDPDIATVGHKHMPVSEKSDEDVQRVKMRARRPDVRVADDT